MAGVLIWLFFAQPMRYRFWRNTLAVCTGLVRQIADDMQFDTSLLATRADIAQLVTGDPSRLDRGWRGSIAGDPLRRLLSGGAAAAFDPDGRVVLEARVPMAEEPPLVP